MARRDAKERTRGRILDAAARRLREVGLLATSVADVMEDAGLTHGGFYAHFHSKQELALAAFAHAMKTARRRWFEDLPTGRKSAVSVLIRRYLHRGHRDDAGMGCPLPNLAPELARDQAARAIMENEIMESLAALSPRLDAPVRLSPEERAIALLALCVGGLVLSRATKGALSDRILLACRHAAFTAFTSEDLEESA